MRWKTTTTVAWQMIGPEAVLVDVDSGTTLGLNETGSFIWKRLGSLDEAEIASELATEYRIPVEDAVQDVCEFLDLLRSRGFVAPVE